METEKGISDPGKPVNIYCTIEKGVEKDKLDLNRQVSNIILKCILNIKKSKRIK